jgi:hypothetical protein
MRRYLMPAIVTGLLLSSSLAEAQARGGQFEGFGGVTVGNTAAAPMFGASIAAPLGDHLQLIGEAGRLSDIKSSLLDTALDFTPVNVRMSAWYGEGGLRLIGSRHSIVRPYAEATAGIARLTPSIRDGGQFGAVANTALAFLGQTEPLFGVGAGVIVQGGPLVLDVGYRYKRILAGGLSSAFALGSDAFEVNQVRVGVGVRF